jgi:protein dithiol oxidoreductase (disulfide-forming)
MQRRDFSLSLMAVGAATLAGTALPALAQRVAPKEGTDYLRLARQAPVQAPPSQVEVVEFFAYSCIHCANFEPAFEEWIARQPAYVSVRRVPVAFSPAFVPMQRLYYTLEAMDQIKALHGKVFEAIHGQRLPLTTAGPITDWVVKQGLDRTKFTEVFNSAAVTTKAQQAAALQEAYAVEGTPAMGVAGRYYISGQGPRTLTVASALIAEVRKA